MGERSKNGMETMKKEAGYTGNYMYSWESYIKVFQDLAIGWSKSILPTLQQLCTAMLHVLVRHRDKEILELVTSASILILVPFLSPFLLTTAHKISNPVVKQQANIHMHMQAEIWPAGSSHSYLRKATLQTCTFVNSGGIARCLIDVVVQHTLIHSCYIKGVRYQLTKMSCRYPKDNHPGFQIVWNYFCLGKAGQKSSSLMKYQQQGTRYSTEIPRITFLLE